MSMFWISNFTLQGDYHRLHFYVYITKTTFFFKDKLLTHDLFVGLHVCCQNTYICSKVYNDAMIDSNCLHPIQTQFSSDPNCNFYVKQMDYFSIIFWRAELKSLHLSYFIWKKVDCLKCCMLSRWFLGFPKRILFGTMPLSVTCPTLPTPRHIHLILFQNVLDSQLKVRVVALKD